MSSRGAPERRDPNWRAGGGLPAAVWSWIRATFDDPNRIAWLYIPVLAFLPLTFGSVATFFYFGACLYVGLIFAARRISWVWPSTTAFGCLVTLGYFAVTMISPLAFPFPNKAAGWLDVGTAMHYLALTVLVGTLVQTPKVDVFDLFLNGVRAAAVVSFGHALVQVFLFGHPRATAGMANAIPFGDTAMLAAGLAMVGFMRLTRPMRAFAILALMCGIGGSLLSQTRGALLALPLVMVVVAVHLWPAVRMRRWQAALMAAALAVALGVFAVALKVPERVDEVRQALQSETLHVERDPSTAHRLVLWTYGLEAFVDRPLLGYGSQNAVSEVRARAARGGIEIPPYRHLHNEFMSVAVGRGVVGLLALVLLLAAPLVIVAQAPRDGRQRDRWAFAILLSGSYAAFGLTNLLFSHDQTNTVYATAYLVLLVAAHQARIGLTSFHRPFLGVPPVR
jgi:O-antigen ligase